VAPIGAPSIPMTGWESVTEANYKEYVGKIPQVTAGIHKGKLQICIILTAMYYTGTVYTYLAEGVGHTASRGAFCALTRGFTHWCSGRMDHVEVNLHHPEFCHVRCTMIPSMKPGSYRAYILLHKVGNFGSVSNATCECAAG